MEIIKKDDNTIIVKDTKIIESSTTYSLNYLLEQRDTIQSQKDKDNELRDAELDKVNSLIAEAKKLGVTETQVAVDAIEAISADIKI